MDYILKYDDSDPISIEEYGKKLVGHTFAEVYAWKLSHIERDLESYISGSRKGGLGNLIEEQYFCYEANSSPEPDFPKAGVELKATPYEMNKNGTIKAGERLVLGMISYETPIEIDFYQVSKGKADESELVKIATEIANFREIFPILLGRAEYEQ